MSIKFGSVKGYFFLDSWIMANIIQLSTYRFCRRFLNKTNDPSGRMFDQMVMAARSCPANIAEGVSRHQTSRETEMKLVDVARATLSELLNDYLFWSLAEGVEVWSKDSEKYQWVSNLKLNSPHYTDDWTCEAQRHIGNEYKRFAPALENENIEVAINAAIILCNRTIMMLESMLKRLFEEFKQSGGFTENLTLERLSIRTELSKEEGAPTCPQCGAPMIKRTAKKGLYSGKQFWSCSNYPHCTGTRKLT